MSLDTYTIRCQKNHEPVELTGQDALAHLKACGIQRKLVSRQVKARPWTAPKQAPLSAAVLTAMRFGDVTVESTDDYVAPDQLGTGDTFYLSGRTYTVLEITETGCKMRLHKTAHEPEKIGTVSGWVLAGKSVESVLLVKRAA